MEWVGGVGVIVLMISVLEPSTDPYQLYNFEGRQKIIGLTLRQTVERIWWIYCIYTLFSVVLFRILGMNWWAAVNHGMTAISTGGFAITGSSITPYDSIVQVGVILVMILGAISFKTHSQILRQRRLNVLWQDAQHRTLLLLLSLGGIALLLEQSWFVDQITGLEVFFQWVSALTTCGFSTADIQSWSTTSKLLLALAMIFGGAAGSTAGGLKLNRVSALLKGISWRLQRLALLPHQMMRYKLNNDLINEMEANRRVESAAVLGVLWFGLIFAGTVVMLHVKPYQYSLADTVFEIASALGSAGLSVGITGPELSAPGRITLMVFMWMGRLEIIPVLALIFWPLQAAAQNFSLGD
jgi:trk system potassium uptake protein TrkH